MNISHNHNALVAYSLIVFLVLSLMIAVMPAFEMEKVEPHSDAVRFAEGSLEALGRELYMKEGCATCHTQFLRNLPVDAAYGRGSVAADYALEDPPMLGTQRTGPDLSNVGKRQPSKVWNLIHLYNPRAVVPTSVMPGYPWYFYKVSDLSERSDLVPVPKEFVPEGKAIAPKKEALALVRYLQTLKQSDLSQEGEVTGANE